MSLDATRATLSSYLVIHILQPHLVERRGQSDGRAESEDVVEELGCPALHDELCEGAEGDELTVKEVLPKPVLDIVEGLPHRMGSADAGTLESKAA